MRLYGCQKQDAAQCSYGCCGGKLTYMHRAGGYGRAARKAARKRARREGEIHDRA